MRGKLSQDPRSSPLLLTCLGIFTVLFPFFFRYASRSGEVVSGRLNVISEMPIYVFHCEPMVHYGIFIKTNSNLSSLNKYFTPYSTNATLYCLIIS